MKTSPHNLTCARAGVLHPITGSARLLRRALLSYLALFSFSLIAFAAFAEVAPETVVGKLHNAHHILTPKTATAWCLTSQCDVMVTNTHVVEAIHGRMEINGVDVSSAISGTGPDDDDARVLPGFVEDFKLAWVRDVALLRMKEPLATKGMHGLPMFTGELRHGQAITVIAYPEGHLVLSRGTFNRVLPDGVLQFDVDTQVGPGASGGIVLNTHDQVVGVLFAAAGIERKAFYAVPVWSLADLVKKNDPDLYSTLFPTQPFRPVLRTANAVDAPLNVPSVPFSAAVGGLTPTGMLPAAYLAAALTDHWPLRSQAPPELQPRPVESMEVQALRSEAQKVADEMKNFIALQTLTLPGGAVWQHQVRVIDGAETFRTADGKDLHQLPLPAFGAVPGAEWQTLPQMVANDLRLPVRYVGEKTTGGLIVRVFEYEATAEDGVCQFRVGRGFLRKMWTGSVPCRGQVWTDATYHLVRITQEMMVPPRCGVDRFLTVLLYGALQPVPGLERRVPTSFQLYVRMSNGPVYQTVGAFSDYRMFHAEATIR